MSPNPIAFIKHLCDVGYHPRSDEHSNVLSQAIVDDLIQYCPKIRTKAAAGQLVCELNFTLRAGTADWNVDLVLGPPALGTPKPPATQLILRQPPSNVEIAIEIKPVMTEHRKAIRNRKRDLEAHHEHVHNYNTNTIAGAVLVINAASSFQSPLRQELTVHRKPELLVQHCIDQMRAIAARGGSTGYGLEARSAIIVDVDNVNLTRACYVTTSPALPVGDPLHYDSFIRTICDHYSRRY
jgi:hypothetical protein